MVNTRIAKLLATSILSIGSATAALLGFAAIAHADVSYSDRNEIVAWPDTYASPATDWVPWAYSGNTASAPSVDTTVHQSR